MTIGELREVLRGVPDEYQVLVYMGHMKRVWSVRGARVGRLGGGDWSRENKMGDVNENVMLIDTHGIVRRDVGFATEGPATLVRR